MMRDIAASALKSADKIIDRNPIVGGFMVIGAVFLGVTLAIAVYLGFKLMSFQEDELQQSRLFEQNLVEINQQVYELNQRSVRAIERNSIAVQALVSLAETNGAVFRRLLNETVDTTTQTKSVADSLEIEE